MFYSLFLPFPCFVLFPFHVTYLSSFINLNFLLIPLLFLLVGLFRAGHVARMGGREMSTKFWLESLRERGDLEELSVYGRIILKCIVGK
jgi:hypothetical protein